MQSSINRFCGSCDFLLEEGLTFYAINLKTREILESLSQFMGFFTTLIGFADPKYDEFIEISDAGWEKYHHNRPCYIPNKETVYKFNQKYIWDGICDEIY